jgi:two-component system, sensor histidine kinase RpfC
MNSLSNPNPLSLPADAPVLGDAVAPGLSDSRASLKQSTEALSELAQAKIRFGMNLALLLFAMFAYQHNPDLGLTRLWATFLFSGASAIGLYLWAHLLVKYQTSHLWRLGQRAASIIVDNVAVTWTLYIGGEALAGLYGVYLWITIGYGMRYGLPYLYGNLFASVVGFFAITLISPFWRDNPSLSIGLGIALLVVPIYAAFLIKRLHHAVKQAQAAYAAKSDFVAKVSHELRTPLHGIIAINDLLSRTDASVQQREMIRIISVSSNTLLDLINRILDISKFEDGTFALQREPMDLHAVISDTQSILAAQARQRGLELRCFVDTSFENYLIGAPRQLQEVLINICGNAIKFTEHGTVSMLAFANPDISSALRIEVRDTGPGISKEHLIRIFDPFYQADNSVTRKHGGTGLGTAISRELVRLMGGEIRVESELGIGTTFTIDLKFDYDARPINLAAIYPFDVVVATDRARADVIYETLGAYGVRVSDINTCSGVTSKGPRSPPYAIFVDTDFSTESAAELRAAAVGDRFGDIDIPVFGMGDGLTTDVALSRGYHGIIPYRDDLKTVGRALNFAANLRKDNVVEISVNESAKKIHVLVAEDNSTNQMIARLALAEAGYECTIVGNGEEALDHLSTDEYDIAIIDMHMPGIDGLEVAKLYNFSHYEPSSRIPLVMMTADNRPEVVADADLVGISKFLVKPIKPSLFIEIIQGLVGPSSPENLRPGRGATNLAHAGLDSELIDEEIVLELLGYMEGEDKATFFAEFIEDARSYIQSLAHVDAGADLDRLRNDMHALCGAARTVGARRLANYARHIEYLGADEIKSANTKLRDELAVIVDLSEDELRKLAEV